jgi:glycosyltransferase involved in cell wall biosynthesis
VRILFVHNALRSFVRADRDILAGRHEIHELDLSRPHCISLLPLHLARADLVYVWFAGLHALGPVLAARLLAMRSMVVVGGYDIAALPDIRYGHMAHPWKKYAVRAICHSATQLIAFSHAAARDVRRNLGQTAPLEVIHQGFAVGEETPPLRRAPVVLSIGNVSRESLRRKGHELFVRSAQLLPQAEFLLAGRELDDAGPYLRSIAPPNARLTGYLPQPALDELLRRASVYVQPSAHEGFGCALAEAMAAGCIPVVSPLGSLPEVVGDCGIRLEALDAASLAAAIGRALHLPPSARIHASNRIRTHFSLDRRRYALLALIDRVALSPLPPPRPYSPYPPL